MTAGQCEKDVRRRIGGCRYEIEMLCLIAPLVFIKKMQKNMLNVN